MGKWRHRVRGFAAGVEPAFTALAHSGSLTVSNHPFCFGAITCKLRPIVNWVGQRDLHPYRRFHKARCCSYIMANVSTKLVSAAGLAPAVTRSQAEHVAATLRAVAPANGWRRGLGSCGRGDGRSLNAYSTGRSVERWHASSRGSRAIALNSSRRRSTFNGKQKGRERGGLWPSARTSRPVPFQQRTNTSW